MRSSVVKVGDVAPDFDLPTLVGGRFNLTAQRGQKVVLLFYRGHW
jgi:peroxiredoxin